MKEIKNYNLRKAIQEATDNKLSGLELEMHREAQLIERAIPDYGQLRIPQMVLNELRRDNEMTITLGSTYGHSPVSVYNNPSSRISPYRVWGVTVLEDLKNITEIPITENDNYSKLAEGQSVPQITGYRGKATLTPTRFAGYQDYTNEYLAEQAAYDLILADAIYLTDRVIAKDLLDKALLNFPVPAVDADAYDSLIEAISKTQGLIKPAFVTSDENYRNALSYERTTGNGFLINPIDYNYGKLKGTDIFGTDLITEDSTATIIFADWARAYVGLFGGLQVIINPYVLGDRGITRITFTRFADTAINNLTCTSATQTLE